MAMWNPWRGCVKCSDGCLHCYIHKGDAKRNVNTNEIVKTKDFSKPVERLKNGASPHIDKYLNGWSVADTFGSELDGDFRGKAFLLTK